MAAPPLPDPTSCTCDPGHSGTRLISVEEISKHSTEESCWLLLKGDVWDLTPFLADHPGGAGAILEFAGRDATTVWESIHPPEVMAQLVSSLKVGTPDNELLAISAAPRQDNVSEMLLHACKMGGSTEVDDLLAQKADPNIQGGQGKEAPLHWAARKGLPAMAVSLLGAQANLEVRDAEGQTPLLLAARNSQQKIISELVKAKAEINVADNRGETALHAAASLGSVRLIKLLLGVGADRTIEDSEGNTAADVAESRGNTAAEELLNDEG